jgi:hypothetical protein
LFGRIHILRYTMQYNTWIVRSPHDLNQYRFQNNPTIYVLHCMHGAAIQESRSESSQLRTPKNINGITLKVRYVKCAPLTIDTWKVWLPVGIYILCTVKYYRECKSRRYICFDRFFNPTIQINSDSYLTDGVL